MSSFWVETIFVSCVIDCIRYTIITCEWVWASLYKICPVGATLPQFTGFVSLNVIAGWISRIGALKEIINNYSISSPNYQFRFLTKVYFHENFQQINWHFQLHRSNNTYPHIMTIVHKHCSINTHILFDMSMFFTWLGSHQHQCYYFHW